MLKLLKLLTITLALGAATTATAQDSCTSADVEARQTPLMEAFAGLLQTDPQNAQRILMDMQEKMAAAIEANDENAVCLIFDAALVEMQG